MTSRIFYRFLALTLLFVLSAPMGSFADGSIPLHELRLVERGGSVPLGLSGWLVEDGTPYTVAVVTPPAFGKLTDENYQPYAEFWQAGADRIGLEIQPLNGPSERRDFLLVALDPQITNHQVEDFDPGWPAGWTVDGDPNTLFWVADGASGGRLRGWLGSPEDAATVVPPSGPGRGTEGYHAQGTAATVIPDPPEDVEDGWVAIWQADSPNAATGSKVRVELRLVGGLYQLRATFLGPVGTGRETSTPWREVPADRPVRIELWSGPVIHDPVAGNRVSAVRFSIDRPWPMSDTEDWIDADFEIDGMRLGFLDPVGFDGLGLALEDVETWEELDSTPIFSIVRDGFEGGGFDGTWNSVVGPVAVHAAAALAGDWGLGIDVAAQRTSGGQAALISGAPAAEKVIGALFRVDLSGLHLEQEDRLELLRTSEGAALGLGPNQILVLRWLDGEFLVRLRARDDATSSWLSTAWQPVTAAVHDLAILWRAGDGDGSAALWIDGQEAGRLSGLGNGNQVVSTIGVGSVSSSLVPIPGAQPVSELHIDEVVIFR